MIYTDGTHVISDISLDELHEFCKKAGLGRWWFEDHERHPHYDLGTRKNKFRTRHFENILTLGAELVTNKKLITIIKNSKI